MEEFLKNARKQLEELELEKQFKDFGLSKLDVAKLRGLDLKKGSKDLRQQLEHLDFKKREEEAATEGFIGGLILGAVLGAILALIFAPKSGSETRQMVAGTAAGLKNKAEDMVQQTRSGDASQDGEEPALGGEPAIEREIDTGTGDMRSNSPVM